MPTVSITDTFLKNLKPAAKQVEYMDIRFRGFGLRVSPGGTKTFFIRGFHRGKRVRFPVGKYVQKGDLARARREAREVLSRLESGEGPKAKATVETFEALAKLYLEKHAKLRKKTWAEDERVIESDLFPLWRKAPIAEIGRADVRQVLERINDRGAPVMANRCRSLVVKMFNFAVERELLDFNPAAGIPRMAAEKARQRTLTDREIQTLWSHWVEEDSTTSYAFRLFLLTMCRRNELLSLPWQQVHSDRLIIRGDVTKNGIENQVLYSSLAATLIRELRTITGRSSWVFQSGRTSTHIVSVNAATRRYRRKTGVLSWSPHDLRRTGATILGRLKVEPHVMQVMLNHAPQDVTRRHYNHHRYEEEARAGWEALGQYIEDLVG